MAKVSPAGFRAVFGGIVLLAIALGSTGLYLYLSSTPRAEDLEGQVVEPLQNGPTVLVFVRTDCPISNRYAPELQRIYERTRADVDWYLVYSDPDETPSQIREHRQAHSLTIPAVRDLEHELVAASRATINPEAAVFDERGTLVYHGKIDDKYVDLANFRLEPTKRFLSTAIEATLAGRAVEPSETVPVGCDIPPLRSGG